MDVKKKQLTQNNNHEEQVILVFRNKTNFSETKERRLTLLTTSSHQAHSGRKEIQSLHDSSCNWHSLKFPVSERKIIISNFY